MSHGFCKTAYDLVVEVAQVPSENIPIFNVRSIKTCEILDAN